MQPRPRTGHGSRRITHARLAGGREIAPCLHPAASPSTIRSPATRTTEPPRMLRLTEIKLPLDHPEAALRAAIVERLGVAPDALLRWTVFKRSYDARKRQTIHLILSLIHISEPT